MRPDTVVVTASAGSFPGLTEALRALPLAVEERPLMRFEPPPDWTPIDDAIRAMERYDAIALTSPRAAAAFAERLARGGVAATPGLRPVWAAGAATRAAVGGSLESVHTASERAVGELGAGAALAEAMLAGGVRGRVLYPCGEGRRDELPERLRSAGVEVEEVLCYRSVLAARADARAAAERAGLLIVASPSVARLLAQACPAAVRPPLLAVGPTTAAAARESGWPPAAVAATATVGALVDGVRGLLARRGPA